MPAGESDSRRTTPCAVYERLAELTRPSAPPRPWAFLQPDVNVRRFPSGNGSVLAGLRSTFSDAEIVESRIATGDGLLTFASTLATEPRILLWLRENEDSTPYDILGPLGCLIERGLPCLGALNDHFTRDYLKNSHGKLFVAFDMRDLAVLRMLELPATLATGLDAITGVELEALCGPPRDLMGADRTQDGRQSPGGQLWQHANTLVLVGWSLAGLELQEPPGLRPVASLFTSAQRCMGFDASRIRVWRPSDFQLKQIQLSARLRDPRLIRRTLQSTVEQSAQSVAHYEGLGSKQLPAGREFLAARADLLKALRAEWRKQRRSDEIPSLLERYNRSFVKAIVDPLARKAVSLTNPMDSLLVLMAAELVEQWHYSGPIVVGCGKQGSRANPIWEQVIHSEELKRRLTLVDRLIAIRRELTRKK